MNISARTGLDPASSTWWPSSVRKASCEFEAERHKAGKEKRRRQKERAAYLPSSSQTFVCPKCDRGAHQESVSTATEEHAKFDHQPSQQSSSARNEPSPSSFLILVQPWPKIGGQSFDLCWPACFLLVFLIVVQPWPNIGRLKYRSVLADQSHASIPDVESTVAQD